eukprot:Plantae.Rhodophyta-Hildenbrandia_rubra.ctg8983.p1 GENE.Plantae.Rhodophyta-Hildenbrandia_rubra.ctg8983~~Plantae.Rhodophyta-Hildenbrandia_rubra.ctg8983.p1  ORF type:complete len:299 (+),score=65.90 Plantae.Rhodophyta-Hildenbrandia_rubra.ctg8983:1589-2485(+)
MTPGTNEEGWTTVTRSRKQQNNRKNSKKSQTTLPYKASDKYAETTPDNDSDMIVRKVRGYIEVVEKSAYWKSVKEVLHEALERVLGREWRDAREEAGNLRVRFACLGLGSFEDKVVSRWQLALALLMQNELIGDDRDDNMKILVYDPVMTEVDKMVVEKFGLFVGDNAGECKGKCYAVGEEEDVVVFYMPHCLGSMYNGIVKTNWEGRLERLVIIGNSFVGYKDTYPQKKKGNILWIEKCVDEGLCNEVNALRLNKKEKTILSDFYGIPGTKNAFYEMKVLTFKARDLCEQVPVSGVT